MCAKEDRFIWMPLKDQLFECINNMNKKLGKVVHCNIPAIEANKLTSLFIYRLTLK